MHGEVINAYKILVEKTEGNKQLGVPKRKLEGNIKTDIKKIDCEDVKWV
jgi:hypothetical protein